MDGISYEDLIDLINSFQDEALHLEMRDSYGTAAKIPHLAKWKAGEPGDTDWLQPWFDRVRAATRARKVFRRARIVSEPAVDIVEAGISSAGELDAGHGEGEGDAAGAQRHAGAPVGVTSAYTPTTAPPCRAQTPAPSLPRTPAAVMAPSAVPNTYSNLRERNATMRSGSPHNLWPFHMAARCEI